jgi:MSHA biogenesis protein MshQ
MLRQKRTEGKKSVRFFLISFLIFLLYLQPSTSFAVTICTTTATGGAEDINGISGSSDSNIITAGKKGEIYQYDGSSWTALSSGTTKDLADIFVLSDTVAYAVGTGGTVTVTTDGGATWSATTPGSKDLKGVWAASTSEVYAVGKKDNLLYYNGTTWTDVSAAAGSTGNDLEEVWGNSSYVYALQKDGTLYIHDRSGDPTNAASWSSDTVSCTGTGYDFKDLWTDASGNVWLAAKKGGNGYIYKYTGTTCSLEFSTATEDLEAIKGSTVTGKITAVGKGGLVIEYDGASWSETSQGTNDLKDVWLSDTGNAYYGGKNGEVSSCEEMHFSISHDGIGITNVEEDITIARHGNGHAINTTYTGAITISTSTAHGDWALISGNGSLVNSGNGDATYTFVGADNGQVTLGLTNSFAETLNINLTDGTISEDPAEDPDLIFTPPVPAHFAISHDGSGITNVTENITITKHDTSHAVDTAYSGTVTISTSTAHGNWSLVSGNGSLVNSGNGDATYTFVGADNGQVILGLTNSFAETLNINLTDGTDSEETSEDPDLIFAAPAPTCTATATGGVEDIKGISGSSDSNIITAGKKGEIYQYDGSAWNQLTSNTTEDLKDIFVLSATVAYAVGTGGTVTVTTDGGANWSASTPGSDDLKGVWAASTSEVYAVGKKDNLLYYNGTIWTDVSAAAGSTGNDLEKIWGNSSYVYALQKDGTLYIHDRSAGLPTNGATWSSVTLCTAPGGIDFKDLWIDGNGDVYLSGKDKSNKDGVIYKYDTGAASCTNVATAVAGGGDKSLEGIYGSTAGGKIIAVGKGGVLLTYNGSTWSESSQGTTDIKDVWISSSGNEYYAGKGGEVIICTIPVTSCTLGSFSIAVPSGNTLTCSGNSAAIDITAVCTDGVTTKDDYSGNVTLSTSSNHGDWSTTTATNTPVNGTADDGAATYLFDPADNGQVRLNLSNQHADDLTITVSESVSTTSAAMSFTDNVFIITPTTQNGLPSSTTEVVVGRDHNLQIALWTKDPDTGNCEIATNYNETTNNVYAWYTPDALHPAGAAAPSLNSQALGTSQGTAKSISFINGVATPTLQTTDVGKYVINIEDATGFAVDTGGTPLVIQGSSATLTVRPFALRIDQASIKSGATANPAAADASGAKFISAGTTFQADITAVAWQTADDNNSDGIPDSGADLSDNSSVPSFAWDTAVTHSLVAPAAGAAGTLSNGGVLQADYSNGTATDSNLVWDEVGIITLTPQATAYLAGPDVQGLPSVNIGRFTPDHFTTSVSNGSFTDSCSTFTYTGQPFTYSSKPTITITPENANNQPVSNYTGSFNKLSVDDIALTYPTSDATTLGADSSTLMALSITPGTATLSTTTPMTYTLSGDTPATFTYDKDSNSQVDEFPSDIRISLTTVSEANAAPIDDSIAANDLGTPKTIAPTSPVTIRYGRSVSKNAYGPETAPLTLPIYTEYYNSSTTGEWRVNSNDNCTTFTYTKTEDGTITVTETDISGTSITSPSTLTMAGGKGDITLTPNTDPGEPGGSVGIQYTDLPSWLGPATQDVEAKFGIYRGNDRIINWQEIVR